MRIFYALPFRLVSDELYNFSIQATNSDELYPTIVGLMRKEKKDVHFSNSVKFYHIHHLFSLRLQRDSWKIRFIENIKDEKAKQSHNRAELEHGIRAERLI